MNSLSKCLASLAIVGGSVLQPCLAASMAASSISESIGASIGSASASIQRSSDSSSKTRPVASGDYTIIDVAAVAETPGMLRVTLRAVTAGGAESDTDPDREFFLLLPQAAFDRGWLAQGGIVTAQRHRYGLEFVSAESRQAFFRVVDDDWFRELQTHPVAL